MRGCVSGFDVKVTSDKEYEITFRTNSIDEYKQVQSLCRAIMDGRSQRRCDTCRHEKEQWFNCCADCYDYELWEAKDATGRFTDKNETDPAGRGVSGVGASCTEDDPFD